MAGSRMFHLVTRTWNPITGCLHNCVYCWSRRLVEKRLSRICEKYVEGFKPRFHPHELRRRFRPGEFVFVGDMGDMWGRWVPREWILEVLRVVERHPSTTFLFLTKNPLRYLEFVDELSKLRNVVLGCTIETDDTLLYLKHRISEAPAPAARFRDMLYLRFAGLRTMVSIEPVLDFSDPSCFAEKIAELEPRFVYVGYDNYGNRLPEPPLEKTLKLIDELRSRGITVYTKTLRKAWLER